jgi:hypothetical protein
VRYWFHSKRRAGGKNHVLWKPNAMNTQRVTASQVVASAAVLGMLAGCMLPPRDGSDTYNAVPDEIDYRNGWPTGDVGGEVEVSQFVDDEWGNYDRAHRWHEAPERYRSGLEYEHAHGRELRGYDPDRLASRPSAEASSGTALRQGEFTAPADQRPGHPGTGFSAAHFGGNASSGHVPTRLVPATFFSHSGGESHGGSETRGESGGHASLASRDDEHR